MIRNFVYLDTEKLNSISSQMFAGLTETVVEEQFEEKHDEENQKGPVASGKVIGEIIKNSTSEKKLRFLNDYSYTLFEKELFDKNLIDSFEDELQVIDSPKNFVRIKATVIFNDSLRTKSLMSEFNKFGINLTTVLNHKDINAAEQQIENSTSGIKDRNAKAKAKTLAKSHINIEKLAKESGLQMDSKFLDSLAEMIEYGYADSFDIQMSVNDRKFSSTLNDAYFRESKDFLVRKYGRKTQVEFYLMGIVTQNGANKENSELENEETSSGEDEGPTNMREAMLNMVDSIRNIENTFTIVLENEVIIDPIALYTSI